MKYFGLILIGLGLAISGYLFWRHLLLAGSAPQTETDFCSALFGTGCDDALRSPLAVQLGIPLAGWGLVYYGTLCALLLLGRVLGETFRFDAMTAALLLAGAAAVGSIALFAMMVTGRSPFCPLCATVHGINLLLLVPTKRLTGRSLHRSVQAVGRAIDFVVTGKTTEPMAARWKFVGFITAGLVAVVIYQWVYVEFTSHTQAAEAPFDPHQVVAQFESSVRRHIPVSKTDRALGPFEAPLQMIVFSDFRCPGCRKLARMVPALAKQFGDALRIVFKHYPLDSTCNPAAQQKLHPGACKAARAAEAAAEQGQFWAFHDSVFATPRGDTASMKSIAEKLDLDLERFETQRAKAATRAKIQSDIELGTRLGVDGTPSVFINGRRIYDIRPKILLLLIAHEILAANQVSQENPQQVSMAAH